MKRESIDKPYRCFLSLFCKTGATDLLGDYAPDLSPHATGSGLSQWLSDFYLPLFAVAFAADFFGLSSVFESLRSLSNFCSGVSSGGSSPFNSAIFF